jgi:excinuclease ABC subunit C
MDLKTLPHSPGVYLMRDEAARILYVGKARDLSKRVSSYFAGREALSSKIPVLVSSIHHIDYIPTASEREALLVERSLIRQIQPHFNTMWRDDKSYPYVKISWNEECPSVYLTRKKQSDGAAYFGPFTNVKPIRRLLRYLWNKPLFALRPGRSHTQKNPVTPEDHQHCRQIAKEIELFFRGRFRPLQTQWEKEMKSASVRQDYERAAQLRDNLQAITHVHERVTVRQIEIADVESHVDRSRAITDLQKALNLPNPPIRIECFDISHIQGMETVASLVVFERGLPKKSDYRKFIIRTVDGIDDFASMAEVVGRRYRRLVTEGRPLPDLILIDGGKGQLSAACEALRLILGTSYKKLSIAALAKREEELFRPDHSDALRLPKDSPALLLVQSVRDEAHRFAITFHRLRRGKHLVPTPRSRR